jgi:predicted RNase H-like HicB family nuclease
MRTIEDMRTFTFPVIIEKDEDGFFAECPALDGCFTQGDTYEEALDHIKEAIQLCLEVMEIEHEEIPRVELPQSEGLLTVEVNI